MRFLSGPFYKLLSSSSLQFSFQLLEISEIGLSFFLLFLLFICALNRDEEGSAHDECPEE